MHHNLLMVLARQYLLGGQWASYLLHNIGQCILLKKKQQEGYRQQADY
jgi:hypothetical protein